MKYRGLSSSFRATAGLWLWTVLMLLATSTKVIARPFLQERSLDINESRLCSAIDVLIVIGILKEERADSFCTSFLDIQTETVAISTTTTTTSTSILTATSVSVTPLYTSPLILLILLVFLHRRRLSLTSSIRC